MLPRGGAAVLVDVDDAPKENAGAEDEALGAEEVAPENENPEVDGAAVVGSVAGFPPNEIVGFSFLLSLSFAVELEEPKPVKEGAGAGLDSDVEGAPNKPFDVAGRAFSESFLLKGSAGAGLGPEANKPDFPESPSKLLVSEEAVSLDPKEKGLGASLEAAGAVVLASLVVAANGGPPEVDEVVAVDAAPN